jgi:hypothetical protein
MALPAVLVPVDAKRMDWPRLVANAINALLNRAANATTDNTALADQLNALEARVNDKSGWANYRDGTAGQALTTDTRTLWTNNAATVDDSEKPSDIVTYWDTANNRIPGESGDAVVIRLQSAFTPADGVASMLTVELDIGGAQAVDLHSFPITGGAGVEHRISFTSLGFQRDLWESSGAQVYVTADGPGTLSNKRLLVARMHRANADA